MLWPISIVLVSTPLHTKPVPDWEDHCLAEAVHREAKGEGVRGMRAVAQVVINRVNHPLFPNTICGVVFQKGQFSWTKGFQTWTFSPFSFEIAKQVKQNPINLRALWFHNTTVNPGWKYHYITQIGNHHFYK